MVVRRRLIFWLIKAYLAKWGKSILFSFLAGLLVFFIILFSSRYFINLIPIYTHSVIGVNGAYATDNVPGFITEKVSKGLTAVSASGEIKPAAAQSWDILDNGKTYIFHLNKNQFFSDGRNLTSDLVNYNFSDVSESRPDKYTIVYKLKESYAPFLVTVSRPIFQADFLGLGDFKIDEIKLNGNFIQSLTLVGVKNKFNVITYVFYPTTEALKYAYALGDINQAQGLENTKFNDITFDDFKNTIVSKKIDRTKMVTLFYNNNDSILSDKKMRLALSYALPDSYSYGERDFLPYSSGSIYFNKEIEEKKQNIEHAKLLISGANTATDSAGKKVKLKFTIKTLSQYNPVAQEIAKNFALIDVQTKIEQVDRVPANFQIYLGDFTLSNDPDQYLLWHSNQLENITKYKNLRIDKLLEDGRRTVDMIARKSIYNDFQKFLLEDAPASFLYMPIEYDLRRK